jgi:toxin YoeB
VQCPWPRSGRGTAPSRPNAWEDYLWWQVQLRKVLKRFNLLIQDAVRNGNEGIGKPEPLKHDVSGQWSRRITDEHRRAPTSTDEHRLVYRVTDDEGSDRGPPLPPRPLSIGAIGTVPLGDVALGGDQAPARCGSGAWSPSLR